VLLVAAAAALALPVAGQAQAPPAVTGVVRTAGGVPIPGAALRLVQSASGQTWLSWTDQNGRFTMPGLPPGRYRIEVTQLGFQPLLRETDVTAVAAEPLEITLSIAPLEALTPPEQPPSEAVEQTRSQQADAAAPDENAPAAAQPPARGPRAARGGGGAGRGTAPGAPGAGRGRGGFQQVDVSNGAPESPDVAQGQDQDAEDEQVFGQEPDLPGAGEAEALGQAASSDAFLLAGTVGRADVPSPGLDAGGPGAFGRDIGAAAGFGAPGGEGAQLNGVPVPGAGGFAGAGRGGGPGLGGGGGRGGPGGVGGPGVQPLWGLARVARQRANRIRFSVSNEYSNSALNARPYSLSGTEEPKIGSWEEGFGLNLGGPLRIPKLYDGTDRTFFFLNYSLNRSRSAVDQYATVPTLAERNGDFSERGAQLYDPSSNSAGPRTSWGSSIPSGVPLDPAALGLLQYIPEPNLPGLAQNFHLQDRVPSATDRIGIRIQHAFSPRVHLAVNYNIQQSENHAFQSFPAFERDQSSRGQSVTLNLTQNWSRTFIHNSQLFFTRNRNQSLNQFAFVQDVAGMLGITGVSSAPIDFGVPQLNFTNFTDASDPVPSLTRNQTWRFVDSVRILRASHSLTAGFEVRRAQNSTLTNPTPRGAFTFSGALTSQLDAAGLPLPGTGLDFADFLLGLPAATNLRFGTPATYFRNWTYAAFFNDDWRIAPVFTLNWGIRYEAVTPSSELYGHIANLDVSPDFTQAAVVVPGQAGPYSGELPPALIRGDYNNWSPRVGIAWRPPLRHAMTVRAGYSLVHNSASYGRFASSMASQPPWAQAQTLQSDATQLLTLENGFPAASPNTLRNTIAVDPDYKLAYAQLWNLSVETPLFRAPFSITYTGTKGTHLDTLLGFAGTNNLNPLSAGQSPAIQNAQGFTYNTSSGNSIFHALQLRIRGRASRYMRFGATYTLGKSVDNASSIGGGQQIIAQDSGNLAAERGLSSFDVRHQFRANYSYDLPFGERRRFARSGWTSAALGDWSLSGTLTMRSGTPFTARVFDSACQILPGVYSQRADQISDPFLPADQRTPQQYFNTAAFAVPAGDCIGSAARNTITGPGSFLMNLEVAKNIRLGRDGQRRMEIRWEVDNLTNTPNFTGLSTVVNSATFGRVTGASGMRSMSIRTRVNF
jgi:hypothetical protein